MIHQASFSFPPKTEIMSIGTGNTIVEFFSEDMELRVWRYRSCKAAGDCSIIIEASLRALEARISPSAAITLARASLLASASAAMARCSCSGSRASFLKKDGLRIFQTSLLLLICLRKYVKIYHKTKRCTYRNTGPW